MSFININGTKTFYRIKGKGQHSILLIHGAACNSSLWKFQLNHFGQKWNVIAIDLMGHGKSSISISPSKISIKQYADFVNKFLETLNLKSVTLIGHSMGGAISIQFCLEHPEKVLSLGLINTGAKLGVNPQLLTMLRRDFRKTLTVGLESVLGKSGRDDTEIRQAIINEMLKNDPAVGLADFEACDVFDSRESISQIRKPTLIIGGSEDLLTPPWFQQYLHEKIENSILKIIEGAGHFPNS
ncbi:MAG: alpha/beta hydrolase [Candidatus Bathyarchaeia archaeon]|nr:alpha/beta hydrolase [Candidatus Bathyarchaeia archaeon]